MARRLRKRTISGRGGDRCSGVDQQFWSTPTSCSRCSAVGSWCKCRFGSFVQWLAESEIGNDIVELWPSNHRSTTFGSSDEDVLRLDVTMDKFECMQMGDSICYLSKSILHVKTLWGSD